MMRRILCVMLAVLLLFSMAGCAAGAPTGETTAESVKEAAVVSAEVPEPEQVPETDAEESTEAPASEEESIQQLTEDGHTMEEVYAMARKALDQQEIQNLMSWHVMYHCYGLHREEMEQIWVQEPENQATASFGQNQAFS